MRIAYFGCFAGIAGDMIIGALLDAGLDFDFLRSELRKLTQSGQFGASEYLLEREKVKRHSIAGTRFVVVAHAPAHNHGHSPHRTLSDISRIIEGAGLAPSVATRATAVFTRLATAEAKIHDTTIDEIHFHEVGAVDSIIDVVGACIGLEGLKIDRVVSSPIRVGTGTTTGSHGVMPLPAPATLELLRGIPVEHTDLPFEMVTPTGAALITEFAESFGLPPSFVPDTVGYGAGTRDPEKIANLLRVELGETTDSVGHDQVVVLETNIDDMTSEVYGYLMDRIMAAGAKDVFLTPVMMKKNRPGIVVRVIADDTTREPLTDILFSETSTLGVRASVMSRRILPRRAGTVETRWGAVRVKSAEWNGTVRTTPEYDDCASIARQHDVPILKVYEAVQQAILPTD
jgi:pyridinium-3,5-bisthiocarboxylic acid mononucleotide nickel chelatase